MANKTANVGLGYTVREVSVDTKRANQFKSKLLIKT